MPAKRKKSARQQDRQKRLAMRAAMQPSTGQPAFSDVRTYNRNGDDTT